MTPAHGNYLVSVSRSKTRTSTLAPSSLPMAVTGASTWKPSSLKRSAGQLTFCGRAVPTGRGIRPRTAVTLWQALVRPLLEYASELWSGDISADMTNRAERVQMTFLRGTLGLHENGSGVADEVVRDRWAKLKLGYWRRIFTARPDKLRVVAEHRRTKLMAAGGLGGQGWMVTARACLTAVGMLAFWHARYSRHGPGRMEDPGVPSSRRPQHGPPA